jgi:hypothetical protein
LNLSVLLAIPRFHGISKEALSSHASGRRSTVKMFRPGEASSQ